MLSLESLLSFLVFDASELLRDFLHLHGVHPSIYIVEGGFLQIRSLPCSLVDARGKRLNRALSGDQVASSSMLSFVVSMFARFKCFFTGSTHFHLLSLAIGNGEWSVTVEKVDADDFSDC